MLEIIAMSVSTIPGKKSSAVSSFPEFSNNNKKIDGDKQQVKKSSNKNWLGRISIRLSGYLPRPLAEFIAGMTYCLRPHRWHMLVPMVTSYISFNFSSQSAPVPKKGTRSSGFGGMVGQPDVDQILAGYRRGFYLFSHLGPPKWL